MDETYFSQVGVLKNKYGIEDGAQLNGLEYEISTRKANELILGCDGGYPLKSEKFNLERLMEIHGHIFSNVYEWAGKIRTVSSSKRAPNNFVTVFSEPELIKEKWAQLELKTHAFQENNGATFDEKVNLLVDVFVEANHIHPFPEGNGRSLQVFMAQLAQTQSILLDYSKTNARDWNNASSVSGEHGRLFEHVHLIKQTPNTELITAIFKEMATLK